MSDEIVTWTEADKAELLDQIVKAACKCDYGLCAVCDAMVYGGDQVDVIVGARERDIEYWRKRALEAETKVLELTPAAPDSYAVPFFGDYPGAYESTFKTKK